MNKEIIQKETVIKAVRSSGAGGQNVNKVSTKIQLYFSIDNSYGFSEDEKSRLKEKLASKLSKDNTLIIECDETRSQTKNKILAFERLFFTLEFALKKPKQRLATKIPKAVIKKRLEDKQKLADKKANRNFRF